MKIFERIMADVKQQLKHQLATAGSILNKKICEYPYVDFVDCKLIQYSGGYDGYNS